MFSTKTTTYDRSRPQNPLKRRHEPSQTAHKKVKLERGKSIIFQNISTPVSYTILHNKKVQNTAITHSLFNQFREGGIITIDSKVGYYTLTCGKTIVVKQNPLVFQADHSKLPGKTAAIRILKIARDGSNLTKTAPKIVRTAESWLEEAKNHFSLMPHV